MTCPNSKSCKYYSDISYTCNHGTESYCGKYRLSKTNLSKPTNKLNLLVLSLFFTVCLLNLVSAVTFSSTNPDAVNYITSNANTLAGSCGAP